MVFIIWLECKIFALGGVTVSVCEKIENIERKLSECGMALAGLPEAAMWNRYGKTNYCLSNVSIFCPFAFKARSTTLIFVEFITSQQTSLLDDVHTVLAVFNDHKLYFCCF